MRTLLIILIFVMIIFSYNLVSGIPLNKINISDITTDKAYKIQSQINLNQFS